MNMMSKAILFGLAILLTGDVSLAYEEPRYTVLKTYETFELRQYDSSLVAETQVAGDFDEVGGQAFRRLFGFISEDNRPQGKIAMTVPVIQQPIPMGEKTSTTVPVPEEAPEGRAQQNTYRFAFFMPSEYALNDLPKPVDGVIQIRSTPSRVMAARRYSGTWSEKRYRQNEKILLDALRQAELKIIGPPIFARYNAPFSLWFLRRNEVLIEVEAP